MPKPTNVPTASAAIAACAIIAGCGSSHPTKPHATNARSTRPRAQSTASKGAGKPTENLKSKPPKPAHISTGRGGAPVLVSRRLPAHGGLYQPARLTSAIHLAETKLEDRELQVAKLTPQYLQLITTTGQTVTVDDQNRISSVTTPLPVSSKAFPLTDLYPSTPSAIIAKTHMPWKQVTYLQLSALPGTSSLAWQTQTSNGKGIWTAKPDGTHLAYHPLS